MQCVLDQAQREFLALQMHAESAACFFSVRLEGLSIPVQFLLVSCPNISKPLSIWLDSASRGVRRPFSHFFHIRFLLVHVEPIYSCSVSKLGAFLTARRVRPIRIGRGLAVCESRSLLSSLLRLKSVTLLVSHFAALASCLVFCSFHHILTLPNNFK